MLDDALAHAKAMGLTTQIVQLDPKIGPTHADALVRIGRNGEEALYTVDIKKAVHPATLGATLHHLERLGAQAMLVTEYLTPNMAEEFKARHVAFMDTAGNAYIAQPGLFIWVNGRKLAKKPHALETSRAFQPTALQVLFTLLCNPDWVNLPYRDLAQKAGTAHGTVGLVLQDLQREGFVAQIKGTRGTRRMFYLPKLLNQWVDAYARLLRPKTLLGRFYVPTLEGWKDWPITEHAALWGGETAGALLTDYLRPGALTIYADKVPALLAARLKLRHAPEHGYEAVVEVRRRFWDFPGDPHFANVVPPLLAYADLLATGDGRCIETARMVQEGYLARLVTQG